MPSNTPLDPGTGGDSIVTKLVPHDGDNAKIQGMFLATVTGTEDAYTMTEIGAANPMAVDITSATIDVMLGTDFSAVLGTSSVIGAGTEAGAIRVTLATDSTGVLSIDDNGGSITVDGTVTANLGTANVTNAGTFAVQEDGAALTALQLLDNVVVTDGATALTAAYQVAGTDGTNAQILSTNTSGHVNIADGGNAITVDGAVTVSGTATVSGTVTANLSATDNTVLDNIDTNTTGLNNVVGTDGAAGPSSVLSIGGTESGGNVQEVRVDSDGHMQVDVLSGGGGGTQYTEDDAAAANPIGNANILVRADTPATVTSTDGDNVAQRATNYGAAYVQILDSSGNYINTFGGSGGTSATDDTAFTAGSGSGTPAMGFFSVDTVNSGDTGVLAMDASRRLLVSIEADNVGIGGGTQYTEDDIAAANPVGGAVILIREDTATTIAADGDNVAQRGTEYGAAYVQIVDSTGGFVDSFGGGTQYTEDATSAADPVGPMPLMVRDDARAGSLTSADGDNVAQRGNNKGEAYTIDTDANALLTTIDADTGTIAGDTTSIDGKITACDTGAVVLSSGTVTTVSTVTAVTDITNTVTVDNAGTFAVQSTLQANSGVDIGDVDVTSVVPGTAATSLGKAQDSAGGATDTGVAILAIRDDEQAVLTPADGDYTTLRTDRFGSLKTTQITDATSEVKYAAINATASGDNTIVAAAGAGKRIRVLAYTLVSSGTVGAAFEDGAGGTELSGQLPLAVNSGASPAYCPVGHFQTSDNTLLNLELDAAIAVRGHVTYVEV